MEPLEKPAVNDISAVIVSWNTKELLEECITSIKAAASDRTLEIIVVDNGSTDGSAQMVRTKFPDAILMENEDNCGFSAATNQGIAGSSGTYVALVNSDIVLPENALVAMTDYLDKHSDVAAVGPQLEGRAGHLQYSGGFAPSPLSALHQLVGLQVLFGSGSRGLFVRRSYSDKAMPLDWLCAASMVIRREAIEDVGGLDDQHFMYAEDVEYGVRLRRHGWSLHLLPWIRVLHYGGASSSGIPEARILWLGGVFRVAAGQMSIPRFNIFGLLMSGAFFIRYLLVRSARLLPQARNRINREVARNDDILLYARTSLQLAVHKPEHAIAFSTLLEDKCRRARTDS